MTRENLSSRVRNRINFIYNKTGDSLGIFMLFTIFALVPVFLGSSYQSLLIGGFIFSIFAISVDFIWGYGNVLAFGHAAFFGFGSYVMAKIVLASSSVGVGYIGLILATVIPAVVGLVIMYVVFSQRIDGFYFALVALTIAVIAEQAALSLQQLTGGYEGIAGIPTIEIGIPRVATVALAGKPMYYFVLGSLLVVYFFIRRTIHSPFGRVLVAIGENRIKAEGIGYDIVKHQTLAFGLSCAIAGYAGALYAIHFGFVSPAILGFSLSAQVIFWILIGGRGTLVGATIGATFLYLLENTLSGAFQFSWQLLLSILLITIVLIFPNGLVGVIQTFSINRIRNIGSINNLLGKSD